MSEDNTIPFSAAVASASAASPSETLSAGSVVSSSPPSWVSTLSTSSIKADMTAADVNGTVTYSGLENLFADLDSTLTSSTLTQTELSDLDTIAANLNNGMSTSSYLTYLTDALVDGNTANANWTGGSSTSTTLGNLAVGASAAQLNELIGKWYLGTDLPNSTVMMTGYSTFTVTYSAATGSVFGASGPTINDVNQGDLGDCFFECSLAEVAQQHAGTIESMFTANGNGTYGVRFYENGVATYVTVNTELADGGDAFNSGTDIWASLAEKAYTQLQASGVITGNTGVNYGNAWSTIGNGGVTMYALEEISGASRITDFYVYNTGSGTTTTWGSETLNQSFNLTAYSSNLATSAVQGILVTDLANGYDLVLDSNTDATDSSGKSTLVSDHAFSIYGFDSSTNMFEVRNPWGTENGQSWETTFEVSLATVMAADDDIAVDNLAAPARPTLALSAATPQSNGAVLTINGTIDAADAGQLVSIYDGSTLIGTTTANSSGAYSDVVTVVSGVHVLTTSATNSTGTSVSSNSIVYLDNGSTTLSGNGDIVDFVGSTGNDSVTLSGSATVVGMSTGLSNLIVNGAGETINVGASDSLIVTGSNNGISVTTASVLNATGGGNTIGATAQTVVAVASTSSGFDTINVSSDQFGSQTSNGQWTGVYLQASADANVNGSSDGINVAGGDVLNLIGGGDTISGTAQTVLSLSGMSGNFDIVDVSNDQFGSNTGNGQWTGVYLQANGEANVNGSNDGINVAYDAVLNLIGGGDTISGTNQTVLNLAGMNGNFDTVDVSNDQFGAQTSNGQWTGIYIQAGGEATVSGSSDGINVAIGAVLNLIGGGGDTITGTAQTVLSLSGMNGNFDTVNVSNDQFGAQTSNGQWTGVYIQGGGEANVNGSGDGINVAYDAVLNLIGGDETVIGTSQTVLNLSGMSGSFDTVNVNGDQFGAQTLNLQWTGVYLQAGSEANVTGSSDGINVATGSVLNLIGGGDTISGSVQTVLSLSGMNGTFDTVNVSGDQFGSKTANSQWTGVYLQANGEANVTGSSDGINVATGAVVNLIGGGDTINGTTQTVLNVAGTNGNSDTINVSSDTFGSKTSNGQWTGVYLQANTTAIVNGSNDGINVASGDSLTISGSGDSIVASGSSDTFIYSSGFGAQSISGFSTSNDVISLANSEFANFAAVLNDATNSSGNVIITGIGGDSLTLLGISKSALAASDFSFHS